MKGWLMAKTKTSAASGKTATAKAKGKGKPKANAGRAAQASKSTSTTKRGKSSATATAIPGVARVTPRPVLMTVDGGGTRGPSGIARLPSATDEIRERGLRYLLTAKSDAAPETVAKRLSDGTGLPWKVER